MARPQRQERVYLEDGPLAGREISITPDAPRVTLPMANADPDVWDQVWYADAGRRDGAGRRVFKHVEGS